LSAAGGADFRIGLRECRWNEATLTAFPEDRDLAFPTMARSTLRHIRRAALLMAAAMAANPVKGESIFAPAGPVGAAERLILLDALAIMLAIVVPTILAIFAFAWWFRSSNRRAVHMPDWDYSGRMELIVWSIPTLVILFLGGLIWDSSHNLDPSQPIASATPPLQIQVVALDWKWLFIYPQQGIASVNSLVLPAGTPLHLAITSATVFNVFFVPRLGSEIYAMNGMVTQLNLQADQPGSYLGLSAQFSGDGFPGMTFSVNSMPPGQFNQWIANARSNGAQLNDATYRALLRQSQNVRPYTYRTVSAGLFDRVARLQFPPGEGPPLGAPNANVRPFGGK
jgi:cytochrome o ubiquinol oxidase subunit II